MTSNTEEDIELEVDDEEATTMDELEETAHPIAAAIDEFVHALLDIRECVVRLVPLAIKELNDEVDTINDALNRGKELLDNSEEDEDDKIILGIKELEKGRRLADRFERSRLIETLVESLFINLFSAFDKLTGNLLVALYSKKPELFNSINKEISLAEVLQADSIEALKSEVLDNEIETIRRKSYIEQFKDLEKRFNINLTKFKTWPVFVEASQRRNLLTHCDGIVSKQYLSVCKDAGYKIEKDCDVGDQLKVDGQYFYSSSVVVTEVGVMLAQTLWRKVLPNELSDADNHLQRLIYDFLTWEDWWGAIRLSQFAKNLPKHSDEITRRIILINYAIALNAIGKKESAINILEKEDWSAMISDFKLAVAVLKEDNNKATELMKLIGKRGEMMDELAYHEWPLFRDFRDKECFLETYKDIYGYPYVNKLSELAEESRRESEEKSESELKSSSNKELNADIQKLRDATHLNAG
jgi:hypothetical protein